LNEKSIHCDLINNNYKKGEDVLIDCLCLSKAKYIICGTSNIPVIAMCMKLTMTMECLNSVL